MSICRTMDEVLSTKPQIGSEEVHNKGYDKDVRLSTENDRSYHIYCVFSLVVYNER